MEVGGRGRLYTYGCTSCHHQSDSCIKMGSDESHFNVSLIVRVKVTRLFTNHNLFFFFSFFKEKEERKRNRAEALLLTSLTPCR